MRGFLILICLVASTTGVREARSATPLTTVRIASGLSMPLYVAAPPGDTTRLFIVEQRGTDNRGRIKIFKNGAVLGTPFLTTGLLATGGEQGLLGLAFAPDYATSGRFYIDYSDSTGADVVARYTVSGNPDIANPGGTRILTIRTRTTITTADGLRSVRMGTSMSPRGTEGAVAIRKTGRRT